MREDILQVCRSFRCYRFLLPHRRFQKVGYTPQPPKRGRTSSSRSQEFSFRNPPAGTVYYDQGGAISAPIGNRGGILAEVRAALPPRMQLNTVVPYPPVVSDTNSKTPVPIPTTMSKGAASRMARMSPLAWISSVKVGGEMRGGRSGSRSEEDPSATGVPSVKLHFFCDPRSIFWLEVLRPIMNWS